MQNFISFIDSSSDMKNTKIDLLVCGLFEGETFNAKITHTFVNGHLVYKNGLFDESQKGMRLTFDR